MSRLLKEIRFGEGILLTILGQQIVMKFRRSQYVENAVKLVIEADPEVRITGLTHQDGKAEGGG